MAHTAAAAAVDKLPEDSVAPGFQARWRSGIVGIGKVAHFSPHEWDAIQGVQGCLDLRAAAIVADLPRRDRWSGAGWLLQEEGLSQA